MKNNKESTLTNRESEVLAYLVQGKTNKEIADKLKISIHTAKAHVCSIIRKLSVKDRLHVALKVINNDWNKPQA